MRQRVSLKAFDQVNIEFLNEMPVPAVREFLQPVEYELVLSECLLRYSVGMRGQEVLRAVGQGGPVYDGILRAHLPGTLQGFGSYPITQAGCLPRVRFGVSRAGHPDRAITRRVLYDRAPLHRRLKFLEFSLQFFRAGCAVIAVDSEHQQA